MSETTIDFLKRVHNYKESPLSDPTMDREQKRYAAFKKTIANTTTNLDIECVNKIYSDICVEGDLTLKQYVTQILCKNPSKFNEILIKYAIIQSDYFYDKLYDKQYEYESKNISSISDLDIGMHEYFIRNCVCLINNNHHNKKSTSYSMISHISEIDTGILLFEEKIQDFFEVFSLVLTTLKTKIREPEKFIETLNKWGNTYISQKENCKSKVNISTDNFYMLFYIYLRNAYMLQNRFKSELLPIYDFEGFKFEDFKFKEQKKYSLNDVAKVYASLVEKAPKNLRENMKKQFQKSGYILRFKNDKGHYEFTDFKIPVLHYHYFRKKDNNITDFDETDINRLLQGLIQLFDLYTVIPKDVFEVIKSYLIFVDNELRDILKQQSIDYQLRMTSLLTENIGYALEEYFQRHD